jgi:hypothetical protein
MIANNSFSLSFSGRWAPTLSQTLAPRQVSVPHQKPLFAVLARRLAVVDFAISSKAVDNFVDYR